MPIANDRNPPQCRDGANFVRLGHCGAGHPELLSARFPPRPLEPCDALGRSQVVRQRILIPPSGGSNPPAPATHSRNWETSPYAAQSPAFCGPLRTRKLETGRAKSLSPDRFRRSPISAPAEARRMRGSPPRVTKSAHWRNAWLGREDSNLRMAESKSAALPLGYAPMRRKARTA